MINFNRKKVRVLLIILLGIALVISLYFFIKWNNGNTLKESNKNSINNDQSSVINKPLEFLTPINSTEDFYKGKKFTKDFSLDLSSDTENKIVEIKEDYLIYSIDKDSLNLESDIKFSIIEPYLGNLSGNFYRLSKDSSDIRIRNVYFIREDEDSAAMDSIRITTDMPNGFYIYGAITDDNIFFRGFGGNIHYGLDRGEDISIFNKSFKYLVFVNSENPDFEVRDIIVYEISPFTVDELKDGVKYQDGKFEEFFSKDYVDFNTVIQYY